MLNYLKTEIKIFVLSTKYQYLYGNIDNYFILYLFWCM